MTTNKFNCPGCSLELTREDIEFKAVMINGAATTSGDEAFCRRCGEKLDLCFAVDYVKKQE